MAIKLLGPLLNYIRPLTGAIFGEFFGPYRERVNCEVVHCAMCVTLTYYIIVDQHSFIITQSISLPT